MKIKKPQHLGLIRLPQEIELTLFFIREELKSRKLTNELNQVGFDPCRCSSDFSPLIFAAMGFERDSDEFFAWYVNQLDVFCKNINLSDGATLTTEAFNFYIHLCIEKNAFANR